MEKLFVLLIVLIVTIFIGGCQSLEELFPFINKAPVILSEPVITAIEGNLYSYQVKANDPNGDTIYYSLGLFPEGMSIISENGLIDWLPTNNQVGIHRVVVEISDGRKSTPQDFEIEVSNMNGSPQILSYFPGNLNVNINEGDSVRFEIQAEDVDFNTILNYKWYLNGSLVSNSSVTPASGSIFVNNWTYSTDIGNSGQKTVKVIISDGALSDDVQWKINVNDVTPPSKPTLGAITSPTNISNQVLSGAKESNSSIWINGTEAVAISSNTAWLFSFNLSEGKNDISITSRDTAGNESLAVTADIVLDSIAPDVPTLNEVITPTNISPQILSGTKEANSSICINGTEAVALNSSTTWLYSFDLSEGINNISITSRDALGNESLAVTADIVLDSIAPGVPTLNAVISPTNISPQTLSGTKEANSSILINNTEVVSINSFKDWSYSYELYEGVNDISITSRDTAGNENTAVITNIILDTSAPATLTLNAIASPTDISPQILSGSKDANSSIWINGTEAVVLNSSTAWLFSYNLSEGKNDISITSRDAVGNESLAVTADIVLDSIAPGVPTLNEIITPTDISPQILSGSKDANSSICINGIEAVALNSNTTWSYSFGLSEGTNNISITSRDALGNESSAITSTIKYDLNVYVDAKNVSGIENGTETYPFNTIAEGIEAAVSGKSVTVAAETYNEQLVINKGITLQGESKNNTFITGTGFTGNLITITADNIIISGFFIDGSDSTEIGIEIDNYSSITIENNFIKNNKDYGINYCDSNPTIQNNTIESNGSSGIDIGNGGLGTIQNNSITSSTYGIRACGDSSPEINNNYIISNSNSGIYCRDRATPIISYNTISDNSYCGVIIENILGNTVKPDIGNEYPSEGQSAGGNKITGNKNYGIYNKTNQTINAVNNWWGDAAGPKYPGDFSSSGDRVYWSETGGDIIFDPYLKTEP